MTTSESLRRSVTERLPVLGRYGDVMTRLHGLQEVALCGANYIQGTK